MTDMKRRTYKSILLSVFVIGAAWLLASLPIIVVPQLTWLPSLAVCIGFGILWGMAVICIKGFIRDCSPTYYNLSKSLADESFGNRDIRTCLIAAVFYGLISRFLGNPQEGIHMIKLLCTLAAMLILKGTLIYYLRRRYIVMRIYQWWIAS